MRFMQTEAELEQATGPSLPYSWQQRWVDVAKNREYLSGRRHRFVSPS